MTNELIEAMRIKIQGTPVEPGVYFSDNLAIALATYFDSIPQHPDDSPESENGWSEWVMEKTDAAIAAIVKGALSAAESAGYRLVPIKITPAMKQAGMDVLMDGCDIYCHCGETVYIETITPERIYRAMLVAAPDHVEEVRKMVPEVGRDD